MKAYAKQILSKVAKVPFVLMVVILLLVGCHTAAQLKQGLGNLRTMDRANRVLGYPDGSYEIGNDIVYVWQNSGSFVLPQTNTNYHSGTMKNSGTITNYDSGTTFGNIGSSSYSGTTTTTTYQNVPYKCEIKIIASKNNPNIIKTWNYQGDIMGGCSQYIISLKQAGLVR